MSLSQSDLPMMPDSLATSCHLPPPCLMAVGVEACLAVLREAVPVVPVVPVVPRAEARLAAAVPSSSHGPKQQGP